MKKNASLKHFHHDEQRSLLKGTEGGVKYIAGDEVMPQIPIDVHGSATEDVEAAALPRASRKIGCGAHSKGKTRNASNHLVEGILVKNFTG